MPRNESSEEGISAQARQALRNVQAAMEAARGRIEDVVSLRIYLVNYKPADAAAVSAVLKEFFPSESAPASTWIGVSSLAVADFLREIEAIAVVE